MKNFDWKQLLQKHRIFCAVHERKIDALLVDGVSEERVYAKGVDIVHEGDIGDSVFVIGEGSAEAILEIGEGPPIHLSTMRRGEVFGEMAFFEGRPRAATVRAKEPCTVLEINGQELHKLVDEYPDIQFKLLLQMSERLRYTNERILAQQLKSVDEKLKLFNERLDTEHKVVEASVKAEQAVLEASLKAAQAMFDQTKLRADEVINSAERSRDRLNKSAAVAGMFVTVLIGLAGLFGWSKVNEATKSLGEIKKSQDEAKKSSEQVADLVELAKTQATESVAEAKKSEAEAKKSEKNLKELEGWATDLIEKVSGLKETQIDFYRNRFIDALQRGSADIAYQAYTKIKLAGGLGEVLTTLLSELEREVVAKAPPPQPQVENFIALFKRAVSDADDRPREKLDAYYLLLVYAYLADQPATLQDALTALEKYRKVIPKETPKREASRELSVLLREPGQRGQDLRKFSDLAFVSVGPPH